MRNIFLFVLLLTCCTTFAWQRDFHQRGLRGVFEKSDETIQVIATRNDTLVLLTFASNGSSIDSLVVRYEFREEAYPYRCLLSGDEMGLLGFTDSLHMVYVALLSDSGRFVWERNLSIPGINSSGSGFFLNSGNDTVFFMANAYLSMTFVQIDRFGSEVCVQRHSFTEPVLGGHFAIDWHNEIACLTWHEHLAKSCFLNLNHLCEVECSTEYDCDIIFPADTMCEYLRIVADNIYGYYIIGRLYSVYDGIYQIAIARVDSCGSILRRNVVQLDRWLMFGYAEAYMTFSNHLAFFCSFYDGSPAIYICDTLGNIIQQNEINIVADERIINTHIFDFYPCSNGDFLVYGDYRYVDTLGATAYRSFLIRIDSLGNDVPGATGIYDKPLLPKELNLCAYPNPFNSTLAITTLPNAQIEIYDLKGNLVFSTQTPTGKVKWCPSNELTSGVYFVKTSLNQRVTSKRIVMVK